MGIWVSFLCRKERLRIPSWSIASWYRRMKVCVPLSPLQRVIRVKKIDEGEEEGVGLSEEEIAALSQGTFQLPTLC